MVVGGSGEIQPIDNILICDHRWAIAVAKHIYQELKLRDHYNAEIRNGVAIEPVDSIKTEMQFGRENETPPYLREAFVTKKTLSFDGALRSELEYTLEQLPPTTINVSTG